MGYNSPKRRPPELNFDSLTAHYDDENVGRLYCYSFGPGEEIPVRNSFIDFGSLMGTPPDSPRKTISTAPARMGGFSIRGAFDSWKVVTSTEGSTASPSNASCGYTIVAGPPSTASSTRLTVTTDCSILHDVEQAEDEEIRGKAKRALLSAAKSGTLEAALKKTLKGAGELPDVRYRLSSLSSKAAAWRPYSHQAAAWKPYCSGYMRSPRSPCGSESSDPSFLLHSDLAKEGFGTSSSASKPNAMPEVLDPAAWAQLHAPFQQPRTSEPTPFVAESSTADAVQQPMGGSAQEAPAPRTEAASQAAHNAGSDFLRKPSVSTWIQRPRKYFEDAPAKPPGDFCMHATASTLMEKKPAALQQESTDQVTELGADDADSSDDDSSDEDLGLCPTYTADAPIPSQGSALHGEGACKRCCFFPKGRCTNGYDCQFCHFAHEKRKTKNKKKKKKKGGRERRKNKTAPGHGNDKSGSSANCAPGQQAQMPHLPSVHRVVGASPSWPSWSHPQEVPKDRPSRLVCHDLQFVPPTVQAMPIAIPVMQQTNGYEGFAWSSSSYY